MLALRITNVGCFGVGFQKGRKDKKDVSVTCTKGVRIVIDRTKRIFLTIFQEYIQEIVTQLKANGPYCS